MEEYSYKITGPKRFLNKVLPYCTILNGVIGTKTHIGRFRATLTIYFDTKENRKSFEECFQENMG